MESLVKLEYEHIDIKEEIPETDLSSDYREYGYTAIETKIELAPATFDIVKTHQTQTESIIPNENVSSDSGRVQMEETAISTQVVSERPKEETLSFNSDASTFLQRNCIEDQEANCNEGIVSGSECGEHTSKTCNLEETPVPERPFSCYVCEKAFPNTNKLKRHLRSHTLERRFSCDVCKKAFTFKYDLKRHMFIHAKERKFPCNVCKKTFYTRCNMKTHQLTHTTEKPFSCTICTKAFSHVQYLKRHLLTHKVERPLFSCDICKKTFSSKENVKYHMITHTEERPFPCAFCKKSFRSNYYLKMHMSTHIERNLALVIIV